MGRLLIGVSLWMCCSLVAAAQAAKVQGARIWAAPDHTRIVFDISAPVSQKVFTMKNPRRVVVDIKDSRLATSFSQLKDKNGRVTGIRSGVRNGDDLRLVLDIANAVQAKAFLLAPNATYGHRLVLDLYDVGKAKQTAKKPVTIPSRPGSGSRSKSIGYDADRDFVIAIDAGHGGEDPGAKGPRGVREKTVVLQIARRLAAMIDKEPGMRAVLLRDGDYYIGLRKRVRKARKHQADLLVSIHADAFHDRRVHGSSVYVVSRKGASNEMARWLAERENASDLAGGVSLDDKDDLLKTVLLDLSQSASIEASIEVASDVLKQLKPLGKVHKSTVQKAGFMVLKSPDIPSILVETAFISNPDEERRLINPRHQQKVARALFNGIRENFTRTKPRENLHADTRHLIEPGDTLSEIAEIYQVSVKHIRIANNISGDSLRVGDVLRIPTGSDS